MKHLTCLALFVLLTSTWAQAPPEQITLQGYLADQSGGTPVPAQGLHTMTFELHDAPTGGSMLVSSGALGVTVADGLYQVSLPFGPALFADAPRYLQIVVDGETLAPRLELLSSPFAYVAAEARDVADGVVTPGKLALACAPGQVLQQGAGGWQCIDLPGGAPLCSSGDFIQCYDADPTTIGVGPCRSGVRYCDAGGSGFGACSGVVLPSAESCDGIDNDCDGAVDDAAVDAGTWYPDLDADGFGDDTAPLQQCDAPAGFVATGGDCDDADATIRPDALDVCDGVDNDCDGAVDDACVDHYCTETEQSCLTACNESCDGDAGCGLSCGGGCGLSPECSQRFAELGICGNGFGCDGPTAEETDFCLRANCPSEFVLVFGSECSGAEVEPCGSDVGACQQGSRTCEGQLFGACVGEVAPAPELCADAIDNDCDGATDEEGDLYYVDADLDGYGWDDPGQTISICGTPPAGYAANALDCDDTESDVNPAAHELCDDETDNDCDPQTDDESRDWFRDLDADGYGDPANVQIDCAQPAGHVEDASDCDDTDAAISPAATEICDGVDNDCNGFVDEFCLDYCELAFPPSVTGPEGTDIEAYVNYFEGGRTDASSGYDPIPGLVVELAFGPDGSDPATWSWVEATPNTNFLDPTLDQQFTTLSLFIAGSYDYAGRVSLNDGTDWTYCDLDGSTNGYDPAQAGQATITP